MATVEVDKFELETTVEEWDRLLDFSEAPVYPSSFVARAKRDFDRLTAALSEARKAIAWANNSLFGSHGFFLSLDGGPPNEHHLDRPIEELKAIVRKAPAREAAAREEEREACTKIVEDQPYYPDTNIGMRQQWVKDQIAAAIRARSKVEPPTPRTAEIEGDFFDGDNP